MTITNISTMIYLGNLPPIDTDETDFDTDNAESLIGTYDAFDVLQMVDVTNKDVDEDGAIYDDETGTADHVQYTLDGTGYTQDVDATITYLATITEEDGTTHDIEVLLVQMANGDVFINDLANAGNLDNLTIRTVELTAPGTTSAAGYFTTATTESTTVCFAAGTLIDMDVGQARVETLKVGDRIRTLDAGPQPIRMIATHRLARPGHNAPIRIAAGALGQGQPATTLRVSPQHRILIDSDIAQRMFGCPQVLVPAKRLLVLDGITQDPGDISVRYWHLALDRHHVLRANGAWAETLFAGEEALRTLPHLTRDGSWHGDAAQAGHPARPLPRPPQQKRLLLRHCKNRKPLVEAQPSTLV